MQRQTPVQEVQAQYGDQQRVDVTGWRRKLVQVSETLPCKWGAKVCVICGSSPLYFSFHHLLASSKHLFSTDSFAQSKLPKSHYSKFIAFFFGRKKRVSNIQLKYL